MYLLRRFVIAILFIVVTGVALSSLKQHLDPNKHKSDEEREDARWIATSKYWLDRQACRWIAVCGIAHWHPDPAAKRWKKHSKKDQEPIIPVDDIKDYKGWAKVGRNMSPDDWEGDHRVLKDVPEFVLEHAPLIHLHSKEQFWPSDIAEHLFHTTPHQNHTSLHMNASQHSVYNLHHLNDGRKGKYLFMESTDDVEERPYWLGSAYNKPIPYYDEGEDNEEVDRYTQTKFIDDTASFDKEAWFDSDGLKHKVANPIAPSFRAQYPTSLRSKSLHERRQALSKRNRPVMPDPAGYSPAPAILVLVDKGHGILDAFWFYFYSYNLGTTVLNIRFGNHIGDWEHSLVRFQNGVPKAVFFSAHSGGLAYSYNAVEKGEGEGREGRPILYSATGTHAMYATPGNHPYILPFGLLADVTDRGPLWDPALNYLAYHFNTSITHDQDAKSFASAFHSQTDEMKIMQDTLQPASCNPAAPTSWLWYRGHWGDKFYELADWRQWRFVGQYHYVNGPFGPLFKNLGRSKVCQSSGSCRILESIKEGNGKSWIARRRP
jgi:hypothetical protein